jgi:hypothetical protein
MICNDVKFREGERKEGKRVLQKKKLSKIANKKTEKKLNLTRSLSRGKNKLRTINMSKLNRTLWY